MNLRVLAGVAKPNPKMGQSLGPLGVNMMKFCEEFNKQTSHIRGDVLMKVRLTAYTDRTFKFIIKPPETTWFLHRVTKLETFSSMSGYVDCGEVHIQSLYEIAKIKKEMDPELRMVGMPQIMTVPTLPFR